MRNRSESEYLIIVISGVLGYFFPIQFFNILKNLCLIYTEDLLRNSYFQRKILHSLNKRVLQYIEHTSWCKEMNTNRTQWVRSSNNDNKNNLSKIAWNIFEQRTQLCSHAKRLPSFFDLLSGLVECHRQSYWPYIGILHQILLYNTKIFRIFQMFFSFSFSVYMLIFSHFCFVVVAIVSRTLFVQFMATLEFTHANIVLILIKSFQTESRLWNQFVVFHLP